MTTIAELKMRSRREVTSPFTEMIYGIRSLSQIEFSRVQLDLILPIDSSPEPVPGAALAAATRNHLKVMQWVIEHGVVNPKVIYGPEDSVRDGEVHCSWIAQDEAFLYTEVLKHSGLDENAQAALKDFLKNEKGSGSITASPGNTDVSPANSSTSGPLN